jgi:protein O-GlcNAc transferase
LMLRLNRAITDSIRLRLDPPAPPLGTLRREGPLRLAYLSHNFGQHPTAYLTQDLYGLHDRSRFVVHGFALNADDGGPLRRKIASTCDHWVDAHGLHPREVAQRIREQGIEVLVAMGGYQEGPVVDVCLYRPAPVQVNYLGYQATLGCPEVAFHITDRHCTLQHEQAWWDEALVHLSDTHFAYPYRQAIGPRPPRADEGLPDNALVLCGFNNGYKIEPRVFAVWCELLRRLPHAVLWIYQSHPQQAEHLRRALTGAGIEPGRLVASRFEPDAARHLARLTLADLFIDTFEYSAHTTMLDALYAGVPPVSVAGTTTVGRLGASLVRAAGLPENVCADREAYRQRVLQLADDAEERERQRQHLRRCREQQQGPFDVPRLTREMEAAYTEMWRQHTEGVAPRGFDVGVAGGTASSPADALGATCR